MVQVGGPWSNVVRNHSYQTSIKVVQPSDVIQTFRIHSHQTSMSMVVHLIMVQGGPLRKSQPSDVMVQGGPFRNHSHVRRMVQGGPLRNHSHQTSRWSRCSTKVVHSVITAIRRHCSRGSILSVIIVIRRPGPKWSIP